MDHHIQAETEVGVPALAVDYTNIDSIREVLEKNNIHTVISCVNYEGDALAVAQLNLIKASTNSSTTKRFIPSTFGIAYPES
ncbi:hypothetical protein AUP68_04305 [Ilyonectria robusta]